MYNEIFLKWQTVAVKRWRFPVHYKRNTFFFSSEKLNIDWHLQQGGEKPSLTDF